MSTVFSDDDDLCEVVLDDEMMPFPSSPVQKPKTPFNFFRPSSVVRCVSSRPPSTPPRLITPSPIVTKRKRSDDTDHPLIIAFRSAAFIGNQAALVQALNQLSFTDLIRLAVTPELKSIIQSVFDLRGVPLLPEFTLFEYQVAALDWMRRCENDINGNGIKGGIICMKMGMGKTLTALTHILTSPKGQFPSLVVVSKTVMLEWMNQGSNKFFDMESPSKPNILFLHRDYIGDKKLNALTRSEILTYDIVITSYDLLISVNRSRCFYGALVQYASPTSEKPIGISLQKMSRCDHPELTGSEVLYGTPWHRVICDESQRFANPSTVLFKCVMALYGNYKWCLSGTPIRNYETDIWSQLRFCGYSGVEKASDWVKKGREIFALENLSKHLYTMTYEEANIKLPEIHEHVVNVSMNENQRKVYELTSIKTKEMFDRMMRGTVNFANVLVMFTRLRQCSIAPFLITPASKRDSAWSSNSDSIDTALGSWCHHIESDAGIYSPKILKTIEILKQIPKGEKIVFFSMFTAYLDLVESAIVELMPANYGVVKIDGETDGYDRPQLFEKFKNNPEMNILLVTYKVGGEGLNLVEANHCILGEPWWTDAVHNQAKGRVWRTGQTREVHVYSVITENSIEDRIIQICREKTQMSEHYLTKKSGPSLDFDPKKTVGMNKFTLGRILGYYF
jgi:SNF2 family DNA or RNA helicase